MTAQDELKAWAAYCARLAKETKGHEFSEPLLTEIRRGWDSVIEKVQRERIAGFDTFIGINGIAGFDTDNEIIKRFDTFIEI